MKAWDGEQRTKWEWKPEVRNENLEACASTNFVAAETTCQKKCAGKPFWSSQGHCTRETRATVAAMVSWTSTCVKSGQAVLPQERWRPSRNKARMQKPSMFQPTKAIVGTKAVRWKHCFNGLSKAGERCPQEKEGNGHEAKIFRMQGHKAVCVESFPEKKPLRSRGVTCNPHPSRAAGWQGPAPSEAPATQGARWLLDAELLKTLRIGQPPSEATGGRRHVQRRRISAERTLLQGRGTNRHTAGRHDRYVT